MMLGIDLGGSKISGVLISGKVISKKRTFTPRGRKRILDAIAELVTELDPMKKVKQFGIGIPGIIDEKGIIVHMPHLPELIGTNIEKELVKATKRKVRVENDAKCFVIAEQRMGAAKGKKNVIGIVLGTGVGSGIMIDGKLYKGTTGGAGEIGHTEITTNGGLVHIEDLVSGPALIRRYEQLSGKVVHSLQGLDDKHYRKVHSELVRDLSIICTNLVDMFDPQVIVFGGGVSNLEFYKDLKTKVRMHAIPRLYKDCLIVRNKLGDDAGAIGAAILGTNI